MGLDLVNVPEQLSLESVIVRGTATCAEIRNQRRDHSDRALLRRVRKDYIKIVDRHFTKAGQCHESSLPAHADSSARPVPRRTRTTRQTHWYLRYDVAVR